jgi:ssDNA-specific exonuclease RecJ
MWTERDKLIAKALTEPDTLAFLKKIFVDLQMVNGKEIEKNVVALDDAEYGRMMKVIYLAKQEGAARINLITKIASDPKETKTVATAPK